jgi:hypothetical protein
LNGVSTLDEPDEDHNDSYHKQNMNEAPYRIGRHEPQEPQNDQNGRNSVKHSNFLFGNTPQYEELT